MFVNSRRKYLEASSLIMSYTGVIQADFSLFFLFFSFLSLLYSDLSHRRLSDSFQT